MELSRQLPAVHLMDFALIGELTCGPHSRNFTMIWLSASCSSQIMPLGLHS